MRRLYCVKHDSLWTTASRCEHSYYQLLIDEECRFWSVDLRRLR